MFARITKLQHYFSRRQTPTLNWVTINRGAIWHNYNVFRGMLRESDMLIPVLKSNAYGHGLREVDLVSR